MNSKWNELRATLQSQNFLTEDNPVILSLKGGPLAAVKGAEVLKQYYYIVIAITHFLTTAMVRIPDKDVKQELRRNLLEELGSRTGGESHQELLERLLLQELNIEVRAPWNEATKTFISQMFLDMNTLSPRQVAGMVYALEATATPELLVVARIINRSVPNKPIALEKLQDPAYKTAKVATLQDFLAIHTLDFEVGHESGLRTTLEKFASEDWEEFEDGFCRVLSLMQIWWTELARQ